MSVGNVPGRWGPGFIGFIFSLFFYGITLAQSMFYFRVFRTDGRGLKSLVAFLLIINTVHTYFSTQWFWNLFIDGRKDHALLNHPSWEQPASHSFLYELAAELSGVRLQSSILITSIVICIVQCFYGFRVWRISQNRIVAGLIVALSVAQIGSGSIWIAHQFVPESARITAIATPAGPTEMGVTVVCDFLITGSMVYYLRIKRTGEAKSEAILTKIILYTVHMGLLGCVVALATFIMIEFPETPYSPGLGLAPGMVISQCYSNSLLAILNARRSFRVMFQPESFTLPTIRMTVVQPEQDKDESVT